MKIYEVLSILEEMAIEGKRHFSPLYICERLSTKNVEEVVKILFSNDFEDIIKVNFEIECPEGDTDFIVEDLKLISFDEIRVCHLCGTKYVPDSKNIWVTFDFTKDYMKHVKKKINPRLTRLEMCNKKTFVIRA